MSGFNYSDPIMRPTAVILVSHTQRIAAIAAEQTRDAVHRHTPTVGRPSLWWALPRWQAADARRYATARYRYQLVYPDSVATPVENPDA